MYFDNDYEVSNTAMNKRDKIYRTPLKNPLYYAQLSSASYYDDKPDYLVCFHYNSRET